MKVPLISHIMLLVQRHTPTQLALGLPMRPPHYGLVARNGQTHQTLDTLNP